MMMRWIVILMGLLLVACEGERGDGPVITRGQAMAHADHLVEHRQLVWGPIVRVWPPAPGLGTAWWQIDYRPGETIRSVLVDSVSGWARLPPDDHSLQQGRSGLMPVPGTWVLVWDDPRPERGDESARVEELNARLALELEPLISLRRFADGRVQMLYGWRAQQGILRDARIADRVQRVVGAPVQWMDLSAAP